MGRKSNATRYRDAGGDLRLPPAHGDLQVNACRTPGCPSFGVEALSQVDQGRPKKDETSRRDGYKATGDDGNTTDQRLFCKACRKSAPIKSNRTIAEELRSIHNTGNPRGFISSLAPVGQKSGEMSTRSPWASRT